METRPSLVRQMAKDSFSILTEPTEFFQKRYPEMTFNQSLALGVLMTWLGAMLEWLTRALKKESLLESMKRLQHQLKDLPIWKELPEDIWSQSGSGLETRFPEWIIEGMKVMLTPFNSVITIFITAMLFWTGGLLLVNRSNPTRNTVTISEFAKITALASSTAMVSAILGFLPFGMGSAIGWVYHIVLLTLGFSIRFQISRLRAVGLVFLPSITFILLFSCLIGVIFALFGLIVSSLFHG